MSLNWISSRVSWNMSSYWVVVVWESSDAPRLRLVKTTPFTECSVMRRVEAETPKYTLTASALHFNTNTRFLQHLHDDRRLQLQRYNETAYKALKSRSLRAHEPPHYRLRPNGNWPRHAPLRLRLGMSDMQS